MHYSDPKPRANEDWLCNKVGINGPSVKSFFCAKNIIRRLFIDMAALTLPISLFEVRSAELQEA